jgi:tetratricopeptide (TPR) repeat protein
MLEKPLHWVRLVVAVALLSATAAAGEPSAKELYDSGLRHYNVSEYDQALVDFKSAYQKSGRSELLYNIAQCYRAMGDPARAQSHYRAFLRENPDTPNRADVEKLIAAMDVAIKAQKQPPTEASPRTATPATEPPAPAPVANAPAPQPATPTVTTTAAAPERRPAYKKAWVWGVVGGAVVLVAAGVTVGVILGTRDTTRTLSDFRPMP